ncbi:hypothetical protein ACWDYH_34215 [Nocardia goodfellowii]
MIGYRTSSELPLPAEWDRKAFYAYRYALVTLCGFLVLLLVLAGSLFGILFDDERPPLVVTVGFLPILTAMTLGYLVNGWSLWPRTAVAAARLDGSAVQLPIRRQSRLGLIAAVAGGLYCIALGVCVLIAMVRANPQTGFLIFVVLAGVGALAIYLAYISHEPGIAANNTGIFLTPDRIITEFGSGPITVAWQDISAIRAGSHKRAGGIVWSPRVNTIAVLLGADNPTTTEDPRFQGSGYLAYELTHKQLATDPTRVFHLLRFYLRNPALRYELGTQAGVERFRCGGYDPTPE